MFEMLNHFVIKIVDPKISKTLREIKINSRTQFEVLENKN